MPESPEGTGRPDGGRSDGPEAGQGPTADRRDDYRPRHRKPSLDEVFGDVLPETTTDERDVRRPGATGARDDEILRDVPPHHDSP